MKLLLFDIDATLVLTGGAGLLALNRAFDELYQIPHAMDGVAPHGKTDPGIIREIFAARLPDATLTTEIVEKILEVYVHYLKEEVERSGSYQVLPGIYDVLRRLHERSDVLLGLATGNIEKGARIKLDRGDLNHYFAFGGYGSDSEYRVEVVRRAADLAFRKNGGPIPPEDVWVIGDTPRDIDAGKRAGFRTVGVGTGHYTAEQLSVAGADLAIADFLDGNDQFCRTTVMA